MNYTTDIIIEFLKEWSGRDKIKPYTDIFGDIGIVGDDFEEMIEKYAKTFSVDMKSYLWYFHTNEEGQSIGGQFFTPPFDSVKRIPLTPAMLADFANKGKWDIQYPDHKLPKQRYDLLVNKLMLGLFLTVVIIWLIIKWTS